MRWLWQPAWPIVKQVFESFRPYNFPCGNCLIELTNYRAAKKKKKKTPKYSFDPTQYLLIFPFSEFVVFIVCFVPFLKHV